MKKIAFTLAEVLITLGIIGVVSAMTIPTLVQNYNERVWQTGAEVFERKLEDTLKTMNTQSTLTGHATTESFVEELSKHFKTNKICSNDKLLDCFSKTVYWGGGDATLKEIDMSDVKTAENFGQETWGTNIVGVNFANGVNAMIAYNPLTEGDGACVQDPYSNRVSGNNCLAILYDTTGLKNPNTRGKDLRANNNVIKLGKNCIFKINGTCYTALAFISEPMSFAECTGFTAAGNSPNTLTPSGGAAKKLGIKECYHENDYWAGAVKACGGIDKMPTSEQIEEITSYLFEDGNSSVKSKASELGIKMSTFFFLWDNHELSGSNAYNTYFTSESYSRYNVSRTSTNRQTFCIE